MKQSKILFTALTFSALSILSGCSNTTTQPQKQKTTHLTDQNGMTLYTFDKDTKDVSNCYNGCEAKWPVFYGSQIQLQYPSDVDEQDFGSIQRKDGTMQTTYKSKPLYYFFKDTKPYETKGDGVKGVWHIVK